MNRTGDDFSFSEKSFYLDEFRGRTLGIAVLCPKVDRTASLLGVLRDFQDNGTRVVLMASDSEGLRELLGGEPLRWDEDRLEGVVWRRLRETQRAGIQVPGGSGLLSSCRDCALRLGVMKLLWVDEVGGLLRADGNRHSFMDLADLRRMLEQGVASRAQLLSEIEQALVAGIPAVNLCDPHGIDRELFSYEGSGTLFTRERYVDVRPLGIDDFDAAHALVRRGVAEGYLVPRSDDDIDRVLANGFGAFVAGRHLAGIGALMHWRDEPETLRVEVVSLYALTRFMGEGIGGHLVHFAQEQALRLGCRNVFACTTSERVVAFFRRHGFSQIDPKGLPTAKWVGYDAERRERVKCLSRSIP
ncbi:GNAT family N-acetyltransferase [Myxococcota bacterium]|nr:GNAT family N-acetyltransferase [Myxococcota bacterium]